MLGSLVDIKGSFGKLAGGAKKSIFAALKGLAIGGLILALAEFFDSDMFKKLTKSKLQKYLNHLQMFIKHLVKKDSWVG